MPDPYRWLENPDDPDTEAFISAQNDLSYTYLNGLQPVRTLTHRLHELWDIPRTEAPMRRSGVTVWPHNDGLSDQPQYLVEIAGSQRVLLDPNTLSEDGAVAVVGWSLSPDGALFAYSLSEAGSDWQRIRFRRTSDGADLADELERVKFSDITWHGTGCFYSGFPEAERDMVSVPTHHTVLFHRFGEDQSTDEVVFRSDDPEPLHTAGHDAETGLLVVEEHIGTSPANGLWYRPADGNGPFERLIEAGLYRNDFLFGRSDGLVVVSDQDAPNGRVILRPFDGSAVREIIGEGAPIESVTLAAEHLVVVRVVDGAHDVSLHTLDGERVGSIATREPATVLTVQGSRTEPDVFVGYVSFTRPNSVLQWRDGVTTAFAGAEPSVTGIRVDRLHATSTDGEQVGMFILQRDEQAERGTPTAPCELYGYGGFSISMTPTFNPARLAFIEAGGVSVVTNLRGGNERGETWHSQGMLDRKQQVFDDFIACAEHLIETGIADAGRIGIHGRSNGGLLTAAVMLQRPDLFGAVLSVVPVTDMLRYQHFTAGRYWTGEFGDADTDRATLDNLLAYSPLHNVDEHAVYPPTLITTAESDDRVVPMHAMKFAATLQHAADGASDRPLLLRVETRAGHGFGKPTAKQIEEYAHLYGFLLEHLG